MRRGLGWTRVRGPLGSVGFYGCAASFFLSSRSISLPAGSPLRRHCTTRWGLMISPILVDIVNHVTGVGREIALSGGICLA